MKPNLPYHTLHMFLLVCAGCIIKLGFFSPPIVLKLVYVLLYSCFQNLRQAINKLIN